jgi:hypothetical protein
MLRGMGPADVKTEIGTDHKENDDLLKAAPLCEFET